MDLTTYTDEDLDALRVQVLTEQETIPQSRQSR